MHMHRIRVISPVIAAGGREESDELDGLGSVGSSLDQVFLDAGPASIESGWQLALAAPDILRRVMEAQDDGVDAVVISCMEDPALRGARELATIPVLGTCQTAMHVAALLAHRFAIVTTDSYVSEFENLARVYGVESKLAPMRWVDIPVLDLRENMDRVVEALVEESIDAVRTDRAHAIVFGCTGMTGVAARVQAGLEDAGVSGVPVIDPLPATVRMAQALLDLGLSHSKLSSPQPPAVPVAGYPFAEQLGAFAR
jgi:allantoin racemase